MNMSAHGKHPLHDKIERLEAEVKEYDELHTKMSDILSRTAIALRGPESELTRWSWHDLPELVEALKAELAEAKRERNNNEGMAECMRLFRQDVIDAGIVSDKVAPMFMTEAVLSHIAALKAELLGKTEELAEVKRAHALLCEDYGRLVDDVALKSQASEPFGFFDDDFGFNYPGFFCNQDELVRVGRLIPLYTTPQPASEPNCQEDCAALGIDPSEPVAWMGHSADGTKYLSWRNTSKDKTPLYTTPQPASAEVEMAICEVPYLMLRPGVLYRFIEVPGCDACAAAAMQAKGE